MTSTGDGRPWWGEREVARGQGLLFTIGTLSLAVYRAAGEWQLAHASADQLSLDEELHRGGIEPISAPPESAGPLERHAVAGPGDHLRCLPVSADRSVVVRPRIPLFVPRGEEIRIFVSSPVWVRVQVGKPWKTLREIPVRRLPDTWIGNPTHEDGSLAYALRSHARVQLDEIPVLDHRSITPVVIRNQATDALAVERLNLPVPYLSLYYALDKGLWSEGVTMTRTEGNELAAFKVRKGAPPEAGNAQRISGPRRPSESNLFVRAFSSLFRSLAEEEI